MLSFTLIKVNQFNFKLTSVIINLSMSGTEFTTHTTVSGKSVLDFEQIHYSIQSSCVSLKTFFVKIFKNVRYSIET